MRWFRFAVLVIAATVLQAGLVANLDVRPNLLLVLLVFFAVYGDLTEAVISSFVIGFAADLIAPVMGPQIVSFLVLGTLLAYLHRVVAIRRMPYQAAAVFIVGVLVGVVSYLLSRLRGQPEIAGFFGTILATSLYSAIVGPFLFLPCAWWMRIRTHRFRKQ